MGSNAIKNVGRFLVGRSCRSAQILPTSTNESHAPCPRKASELKKQKVGGAAAPPYHWLTDTFNRTPIGWTPARCSDSLG
jgi:hypothetical protein